MFKIGDRVFRKSGRDARIGTIIDCHSTGHLRIRWPALSGHGTILSTGGPDNLLAATPANEPKRQARLAQAAAKYEAWKAETNAGVTRTDETP